MKKRPQAIQPVDELCAAMAACLRIAARRGRLLRLAREQAEQHSATSGDHVGERAPGGAPNTPPDESGQQAEAFAQIAALSHNVGRTGHGMEGRNDA